MPRWLLDVVRGFLKEAETRRAKGDNCEFSVDLRMKLSKEPLGEQKQEGGFLL